MNRVLAFCFLVFFGLGLIQSVNAQEPTPPEKNQFFENPNYSDEQVPAEERKLNLKRSEKSVNKQFDRLNSFAKELCESNHHVYRVNLESSKLGLVSFKNWNIPVNGWFENYDGIVYWDKKKQKPHAKLLIDTTSWASGAPDRDSRVKYFLLKAQKPKYAIAVLTLESNDPRDNEVSGTLQFRGRDYGVETTIEKTIHSGVWNIKNKDAFRLSAKIPDKDVNAIMKLCNHKSLSTTVDLTWDLSFEPFCTQ